MKSFYIIDIGGTSIKFGISSLSTSELQKGLAKTINVIWFIINGWWMALGHFLVGCAWCLTIIGIPFRKQCFKLARLSLSPFGAAVVQY